MKIVTLLDYNPITGSLKGYGLTEVKDTHTVLSHTLRKYQQIDYKHRKIATSYCRTQHK